MVRLFIGSIFILVVVVAVVSCGGGGGGGAVPVPAISAINGGAAGSGTVGSLFVLDGSGFGTLGAAAGGYSVDFRDALTGASVAAATVNYGAGDWKDAYIKATVPNGLTTAATYQVTVTTPGGKSNAMDFTIVASVAFSPSTITWSASTATLPAAMSGFPTVISTISSTGTSTSHIYVIGGNLASSGTTTAKASNTDAVYYNMMDNTTGGLANGSWTATTSLPAKRGFSAAVYANKFNSFVGGNGHVYVLGGLDDQGAATATVYYSAVAADGTLGAWSTTTALPQALFAHGVVIVRGRIYVAGGNDSTGSPVKTVYSAKLNADGTLGTWTMLTDLPAVRAYHQVVAVAGYIYVIGGIDIAVDPLSNANAASSVGTVYYAQVNITDGTLMGTAWTTNSNGPKARQKFTATVAGSNILVSGGIYGGSPGSSEQQYSTIASDGSLDPFQGATGNGIIADISGYNIYNQSNTFFADTSGKPHIIILGGGDVASGTPRNGVFICSQ